MTLLESSIAGAGAGSAAETEHRLRLADGRTLACLDLGDPAGPPVLYFRGYPGSRLEARVAAAAAGRLGLRLLAVDRPGFGQSTSPGPQHRQLGGGCWRAGGSALLGALIARSCCRAPPRRCGRVAGARRGS